MFIHHTININVSIYRKILQLYAKFYLSSVFEQLKDLLFHFTEFIAALTADGLEHCRNQSYSGVIHT